MHHLALVAVDYVHHICSSDYSFAILHLDQFAFEAEGIF